MYFKELKGTKGHNRLTGAENEPFIIVLSGTERVFIDGKLLVRGEANDYVIDYNSSEISFTPRNMITKDRRIIVEFQYSDQSYARSLFQVANMFTHKKWKGWINAYSEQDAKNQGLQVQLNDEQKQTLSLAGDNTGQAYASSIDTANYTDTRVLYRLMDSAAVSGNYEVLIYTSQPDTNLRKASFTNVGENQGNYVLDQIIGIGRIYKWVEPLAGIPQGNYEPIILLTAPNKNQMITTGAEYSYNERSVIGIEGAYTQFDQNTFSDLDAGDNRGFAAKSYWKSGIDIGAKGILSTDVSFEFLQRNFTRIERFRSVEFERNWNTTGVELTSNQILGSARLGYLKKRLR